MNNLENRNLIKYNVSLFPKQTCRYAAICFLLDNNCHLTNLLSNHVRRKSWYSRMCRYVSLNSTDKNKIPISELCAHYWNLTLSVNHPSLAK